MRCKLSIIIPTYKRTVSLTRLLNILKQQTIKKDIELIIIDQNEKGYLENEIGKNVLEGTRHFYQNEPNVSAARNYGVKVSVGNYILFMDDDVIPDNDFCEKGISVFEINKNIKILSPTLLRKNETVNGVIPKKINTDLYPLSLKEKYLHASFFTISACTFFERETFLKTGGFDPYLFRFGRTAEDQEFFIRLIKNNFEVYVTRNIGILIDEDVAGGCDLRTADYWITRHKCLKAWSYRYRVHNRKIGTLDLHDRINLYRHTFLNTSLFKNSIKSTLKQIKLLNNAIRESKYFTDLLLSQGKLTKELNHLNEH